MNYGKGASDETIRGHEFAEADERRHGRADPAMNCVVTGVFVVTGRPRGRSEALGGLADARTMMLTAIMAKAPEQRGVGLGA